MFPVFRQRAWLTFFKINADNMLFQRGEARIARVARGEPFLIRTARSPCVVERVLRPEPKLRMAHAIAGLGRDLRCRGPGPKENLWLSRVRRCSPSTIGFSQPG